MPHALLHLRVHQVLLAVVVRTLAQAVIPAQPVDVPRERGEVSARKHLGARADDGLQHAVGVGVHSLQRAAPQKVSEKPDLPTRLDERLPARLLGG